MGGCVSCFYTGKESELESAIILHEFSLGDRGAHRNVLSGFRVHSSIPKSEASSLFEFTNQSAMQLVVEPPATVGRGLSSDAILDISYDFIFTAWGLSVVCQTCQ